MDKEQIERICRLYNTLNVNNLELLSEIYREDICFIDPAHTLQGIEELTAYFQRLYLRVKEVNFTFEPPLISENSATVRWQMCLIHPSLEKGKPITVDGCSAFECDAGGKVYFHRDYFDLGAMLYEHLPLIGPIMRSIKRRLGNEDRHNGSNLRNRTSVSP